MQLRPYEQQIDEIMNWFDFDRVHRTMVALNWKWADCETGVPEVGHIRERALALLREVVEQGDGHQQYYIETGGFRAERVDGLLKLSFSVSTWECEPTE